MSRPWKIQFPSTVYQVVSHGNNRQAVFLDSRDKQTFLELLEDAALSFNLHIFAFCLMDNHYHLFLRTPDASLSAAMHWLNVTYANRFHRRHGRSGHLLQGRRMEMGSPMKRHVKPLNDKFLYQALRKYSCFILGFFSLKKRGHTAEK